MTCHAVIRFFVHRRAKSSLAQCLFTSLLIGCGTQSLQPDETETFTTRILDNGTKLFTYRLDTPSGQASQPTLVFDAHEPTDLNNPQPMEAYDAEAEKADIGQRVESLLDKKIEVSDYCRQGYLILERKTGFSRSILSGECREAASAEDRERFSPKVSP